MLGQQGFVQIREKSVAGLTGTFALIPSLSKYDFWNLHKISDWHEIFLPNKDILKWKKILDEKNIWKFSKLKKKILDEKIFNTSKKKSENFEFFAENVKIFKKFEKFEIFKIFRIFEIFEIFEIFKIFEISTITHANPNFPENLSGLRATSGDTREHQNNP